MPSPMLNLTSPPLGRYQLLALDRTLQIYPFGWRMNIVFLQRVRLLIFKRVYESGHRSIPVHLENILQSVFRQSP